jgi:hypothetical protein
VVEKMVMLVGIKLKLKYERNICNKINEVRECLALVENMVMLVSIKLKLKYERNICNKINEVRKCLANIFLFFIFLLLLFFLFHNNFCFGPKHFTPTNTVMFFKNDNTAHPYQIKNTNANQNNHILTLA